MTGLRNSGNEVPNPDAVSQYDVQTNNFSAQLGRYAAAVVSMVTKSGTNQFHGSAFEYYRSKKFQCHNAQSDTAKTPMSSTVSAQHSAVRFVMTRTSSSAATVAIASRHRRNTRLHVPNVAQIAGNFSENTPTQRRRSSDNQRQRLQEPPTAADNTAIQFWVCNRATDLPIANNTLPSTALDPTCRTF